MDRLRSWTFLLCRLHVPAYNCMSVKLLWITHRYNSNYRLFPHFSKYRQGSLSFVYMAPSWCCASGLQGLSYIGDVIAWWTCTGTTSIQPRSQFAMMKSMHDDACIYVHHTHAHHFWDHVDRISNHGNTWCLLWCLCKFYVGVPSPPWKVEYSQLLKLQKLTRLANSIHSARSHVNRSTVYS